MIRLYKAVPLVGFRCDECGFLNLGLESEVEYYATVCMGPCKSAVKVFLDACPSCDPDLPHHGGCESRECSCTLPQCVSERTATPKEL